MVPDADALPESLADQARALTIPETGQWSEKRYQDERASLTDLTKSTDEEPSELPCGSTTAMMDTQVMGHSCWQLCTA